MFEREGIVKSHRNTNQLKVRYLLGVVKTRALRAKPGILAATHVGGLRALERHGLQYPSLVRRAFLFAW